MPWPLRIWPLAVMAVAVTTALVLLAVLIDSDVSRVALPAIAGAVSTIALAVVTVRLSIGNGNTTIGCASLTAVAGFHAQGSVPARSAAVSAQICR
jgi:hypothetical protein